MSLIPSRGRPASPIGFRVLRELQLDDIMRLSVAENLPKVGVPQPRRLRAVHHRAAELLASGKRVTEVARACNLTPQRVTQLQEDPAFCELVAYFSEQISETTIEIRSKIEAQVIDISELALDEIQRRLESDPESVGIAELRQLATAGLDRTVLPPKPAQNPMPPAMNVTFNMGPRALTPKVIDQDGKEITFSGERPGASSVETQEPVGAPEEEPTE